MCSGKITVRSRFLFRFFPLRSFFFLSFFFSFLLLLFCDFLFLKFEGDQAQPMLVLARSIPGRRNDCKDGHVPRVPEE